MSGNRLKDQEAETDQGAPGDARYSKFYDGAALHGKMQKQQQRIIKDEDALWMPFAPMKGNGRKKK